MNKVELYHSAAWVDITNYVVACSKVPNTCRNRDWTIKIERLNITIADTIKVFLADANFKFTEGMILRVFADSTFIYGGYVDESGYSNSAMEFDVTLKNHLGNLQTKLLDYDTLHTALATGTNWYDYTASDYFGRGAVVGVLWTLKKMFEVAGLTLTTTDVDTSVLITHVGDETFDDCTTTFQDLFFYENMLWCIGQPVCVDHSVIDNPAYDYNRDKLTFFDLVSELMTSLKLKLTQTAVDTFNLEYVEDAYSIAADDTFDLNETNIKAALANYANNLSYRFFFNDPAVYGSLTITNDGSFIYGKGRLIDSLENFAIYLSDAKLRTNKYADSYNINICGFGVYGDIVPDFIIDNNSATARINCFAARVKEIGLAYVKEDILTNFQSVKKNVVEHYVDIEWTNSEITQEAY